MIEKVLNKMKSLYQRLLMFAGLAAVSEQMPEMPIEYNRPKSGRIKTRKKTKSKSLESQKKHARRRYNQARKVHARKSKTWKK